MSEQAAAVALLGCGSWGKNLARVFHQLGALALVVDPSSSGRANAAASAPGVRVAEDIDDAFAAGNGAVAIATPAATHFQLARQALEAGKDVFVEKPLTLTVADGRRLVQLARERKRILMVGHLLVYHPGVRALQNLVSAGDLGEIFYVHSNRVAFGKIRSEENVLWSLAPHDIAVILYLLGRVPRHVACCGASHLQAGVADSAAMQLLFDGSLRSYLFVSWLHPFKERRLVIVGSRRTACLDEVAHKLTVYETHAERRGDGFVPCEGERRDVTFAADEPLQQECVAFLESLRSREPPPTDGVSALRVLEILRSGQESLESCGAPVALRDHP